MDTKNFAVLASRSFQPINTWQLLEQHSIIKEEALVPYLFIRNKEASG
jgi:hypothetical protein